jgi:hypothetical protein
MLHECLRIIVNKNAYTIKLRYIKTEHWHLHGEKLQLANWTKENINKEERELGYEPYETYYIHHRFWRHSGRVRSCIWCRRVGQLKNNETASVRMNVARRRVRVTTVTVEKEYSECVCNLSYPACKAHAPYYIAICGLSGCTIFFHIIS